jgi:hypothetical protein
VTPIRSGTAHRRARALHAVLLVLALVHTAGSARAAAPDSLTIRDEPVLHPAWRAALAPDRLEHASLAMTGGLAAGLTTPTPTAALLTAATLGLGKEFWDARRTHFDRGDLAADLAGGAVAAFATWVLTRR